MAQSFDLVILNPFFGNNNENASYSAFYPQKVQIILEDFP